MNTKYIKILILFLLQFFLLSGLWAIDIGMSGMMFELGTDNEAVATGFGFMRTPNQQYHMGLLVVYLVFFVQVIWLLWVILTKISKLKEKKNGRKNR